MRTAVVLVSSTRAAGGVYPDRTGPHMVKWLQDRDFRVPDPVVVADGDPFAAALAQALDARPALIITTGGTGISPTDVTATLTARALDYLIPGIAEEIRRTGAVHVPTALLSRGVAGVAGRTLVLNLPGSIGGVRDGLTVLDTVLDHALDQLAGEDHLQAEA